MVKVNVELTFATVGLGEKDLEIEGAAKTVTVSELELLVSSSSVMLPFGSTSAVLARLAAALGVTGKVTLKEESLESVTGPLAMQFRAVPVMEQLIVPVGAVLPLVKVNAPCG